MQKFLLRRLELSGMDCAAIIHRAAFDDRLPWLAGLHTPAEDQWFYRERVFNACSVWGAFENDGLVGIIAFRDGWIDQLYILPRAQGKGICPLFVAPFIGTIVMFWPRKQGVIKRQLQNFC